MKKKGVITQTSVHVKVDNEILFRLDEYCKMYNLKRNRVINQLLRSCLESSE